MIFRMQVPDGVHYARIELQLEAGGGTVRLGKKSRELFKFLSGQTVRKVRRVLRDDPAEDANDIEFGVTLTRCRALLLHYLEIQILHDVRFERDALIGQ